MRFRTAAGKLVTISTRGEAVSVRVQGPELVCAVCGRHIAPRGTAGYRHRSQGVVAACDLDSDHAAAPDWRAADELTCGACGGGITVDARNRLMHVDGERDADHTPEAQIV